MELSDVLTVIAVGATVVRVVALARLGSRSPEFARAVTNTAAVVFAASAALVIALAFAYLWPAHRLAVAAISGGYVLAGSWLLWWFGRLMDRRVTGAR